MIGQHPWFPAGAPKVLVISGVVEAVKVRRCLAVHSKPLQQLEAMPVRWLWESLWKTAEPGAEYNAQRHSPRDLPPPAMPCVPTVTTQKAT